MRSRTSRNTTWTSPDRVALRFTGDVVRGGSHDNLTAARADGEHLWVAGDETATIDRLVLDSATAPLRAGRQRSFRLADLVQLPGPPDGESDIAGDRPQRRLAVGDRVARAGPATAEADPRRREGGVRRLGKLRRDPNRFVIVRLAVQLGVDRRPEPVRVARDGRRSALVGAPRRGDAWSTCCAPTPTSRRSWRFPARTTASTSAGSRSSATGSTSGCAARCCAAGPWCWSCGPRRTRPTPAGSRWGSSRRAPGTGSTFLDLGGLGVRDLCPDGDDLLVLAGPTMALSGPVGAPVAGRDRRWGGPVVREADLPVETVVTNGEGVDHAEGDLAARPGPARRPRAAAGRLRQPGGGPQAVARHGARRPRADRGRRGASTRAGRRAGGDRGPGGGGPDRRRHRPGHRGPSRGRPGDRRIVPTTPPRTTTDRGHHRGHRRRPTAAELPDEPLRDEPEGPHAANPDDRADRAPVDDPPRDVPAAGRGAAPDVIRPRRTAPPSANTAPWDRPRSPWRRG